MFFETPLWLIAATVLSPGQILLSLQVTIRETHPMGWSLGRATPFDGISIVSTTIPDKRT